MSSLLNNCSCPHCQQSLEYPEELAAQVVNCPACNQALTLPAAVAKEKGSFLASFFQKAKDAGQGILDKRNLKNLLLHAVQDGELTHDEIEEIRSTMQQCGIDESVLCEWGNEVFNRAVDSLNTENVSSARIESVEHVKHFVRLTDDRAPEAMQKLARWKMIAGIRDGVLPFLDVNNVILRKGETVHWVEPAKLWEERVVSRRYEGGSAGMSFRIAKGVTFRTGGTRGQLVSESADVEVARGNFIITNQRFIFQGVEKSFETKFEKILDITNFPDGIRYSESIKQKPRKLSYLSPNGDIIVEILSKVFSNAA